MKNIDTARDLTFPILTHRSKPKSKVKISTRRTLLEDPLYYTELDDDKCSCWLCRIIAPYKASTNGTTTITSKQSQMIYPEIGFFHDYDLREAHVK